MTHALIIPFINDLYVFVPLAAGLYGYVKGSRDASPRSRRRRNRSIESLLAEKI